MIRIRTTALLSLMPVFASSTRARLQGSLLVALLSFACTSEPDAEEGDDAVTGGSSALGGGAGAGGSAGVASTSGAGGTQANSGTGGASGAGTNTGGAAGKSTAGGAGGASGGSSGAGGAVGGGGSSGGVTAGAGNGGATTAGGAGLGGAGLGGAGLGGAAGMAGFSGAAAGASGAGSSDVASALAGLRVDDPCAGTASLENGAVCNHVTLTQAGGFKAAKQVTIGGTPGTTYDVTLRIRGVVEPTNISGGMRANTSTFQYMNMSFRTVPFTVGGTVASPDYAQWHIQVASPAQELYLNDYQKVGHYIFELDYEITVPMAANTQVTLDATDSNEREIVNYEEYALDGIPGSVNYGQFVQIDVVSVQPRAD